MAFSMTGVLVAVLLALVIVLIKFLICNCIIKRRMREEGLTPIIPRRQVFWIDYERMREQPPNFDEALRCSVPVSYVEVEEPPPTYQEFINSSFEDDFLPHSVNPSDSVTLNQITKTSSVA